MAYRRMCDLFYSAIALILLFLLDWFGGVSCFREGVHLRGAPFNQYTGASAEWGSKEELGYRYLYGIRGSPLLLPCHLTSATKALGNVTWLKNGQPLNNPRAVVTHEGHLNITKLVRRRGGFLGERDDGSYHCLVSIRTNSATSWLIHGPELFVKVAELSHNVLVSSVNSTVVVGSSLHLLCQVNSQPPAFFQWEKEGKLLEGDRIRQLSSGILQIINVQKSDAGAYKCSATNILLNKTRGRDDIYVYVLDPSLSTVSSDSQLSIEFQPPTFLYPTSNTSLKAMHGTSATLECMVDGLPQPTITWYKQVDSIPFKSRNRWAPVPRTRPNQFQLGNLDIEAVTLDESGRYMCVASVTHPKTREQFNITQLTQLEVVLPPQISNAPSNITTTIAKTVRLSCTLLTGGPYSPVPKITWYKDGRIFTPGQNIEINHPNELFFGSPITRDTGLYQCMIENDAGFATAWAFLFVNSSQANPKPPTNLRYSVRGPKEVIISWTPSESAKYYYVHFIESDVDLPPPKARYADGVTYLLTELKPFTNYTVYVQSYSDLVSDPSEEIHFQTGEMAPIDTPDFSLEATSSHTLKVSWKSLPKQTARGVITNYKIYCQKLKSKGTYRLKEVAGDVFEHSITGLMPGKTYRVSVSARTKVGYYDNMDKEKIITMPSGGTNRLSAPVVRASSYKTKVKDKEYLNIKVAWNRTKETGVLGYVMRYKQVSHHWSPEVKIPANATEYNITNILPSTYKIKLKAYSKTEVGPSSSINVHVGKKSENDPDHLEPEVGSLQVKDLNVRSTSATDVRLTWKVSEELEKKVAFYTIKGILVDDPGKSRPVYKRSLTSVATVGDLKPFALYEFSVRAHVSEEVYGSYCNPVLNSDVVKVPEPPTEFELCPLDASTLEFGWLPTDPGRRIRTYEVLYTSNQSLDLDHWERVRIPGDANSANIRGLVSNIDYWFKIRACSEVMCGAYSHSYVGNIPAVLPNKFIYVGIGLVTALFVLLLVTIVALYILRNKNFSRSGAACNGHNPSRLQTGSSKNCNRLGTGGHPAGWKGHRDNDDGDDIPMLNRVHLDMHNSTLDTKGGNVPSGQIGVRTPWCNGMIRGRDVFAPKLSASEVIEGERLVSPCFTNQNGGIPGVPSVLGHAYQPVAIYPQNETDDPVCLHSRATKCQNCTHNVGTQTCAESSIFSEEEDLKCSDSQSAGRTEGHLAANGCQTLPDSVLTNVTGGIDMRASPDVARAGSPTVRQQVLGANGTGESSHGRPSDALSFDGSTPFNCQRLLDNGSTVVDCQRLPEVDVVTHPRKSNGFNSACDGSALGGECKRSLSELVPVEGSQAVT